METDYQDGVFDVELYVGGSAFNVHSCLRVFFVRGDVFGHVGEGIDFPDEVVKAVVVVLVECFMNTDPTVELFEIESN